MSVTSSGWPAPPTPTYPPAPMGPRRTEPFAIVSLVCSIAGFAICPPVPGILGIVFGHLALGRIRRSGDDGRGLAIAGVVVGYVTVALSVIVGIAIVVASGFFIVAQDRSTDHAVDDARSLGLQIQTIALRERVPTRSTQAVRLAVRQSGLDPDEVSVGFFGGSALTASRLRLIDEDWRLHVSSGYSGNACLTVPRTANSVIRVTRGMCRER